MVYAIMHRTQILLEKSQYDTLKSLCERKGVSLSNVVREAVALYLRTGAKKGAPSLDDIEGIGNDPDATGRKHDAHLYPRRKSR
jgi:hypothetical protein